MTTASLDDLGEEREVDLRSLRDRIASRWWLVVGGLVLGVVAGILVATGGGKVYDAKALIYMGQPFTTAGGQQVTSLATNPRTVSAVVNSEATLQQVSKASGVPEATLRGSVVSQAVTAVGTSAGLGRSAPLMEITVQLKQRQKAELAANEFAKVVVSKVGSYVDEKIAILRRRVEADEEGLATAAARIQAAIEQQRLAANARGMPLADRLLLQANANTTLQFYEGRTTNLRFDLNDAQQLLSLALNVERSRVVQPAVAAPTTARSRRNSAVVGGLIGLILGGLAAGLLPEARRSRKRPVRA